MFVSMIGFWVILFTGSLPEGMFNFLVGTLRWSTRLNLYMSHMEDSYPPFSGKSDQELGRDTGWEQEKETVFQ